jgi:tetratricopeptide (TPR) repeat protein
VSPNSGTEDTLAADATMPAQRGLATASRDTVVGRRYGRFVVTRAIGRGGMGEVLAARDPELDREVAIKVLPATKQGDTRGRERMVREAQALAKLSHPNVVQIHDVGTADDAIYIAMELIDGETLATWLECDPPRPWRDVVAAFVQAGEGLAAAHRVGLVHRDFKPHNVLMSREPVQGSVGRVRVVDFGLARTWGADTPSLSDSAPVSVDLTRTGEVVGTPAYMAPEQFAARATDARTDQYSFCVSLFQGLYGVRPHAGDDVASLGAAVLAGRIVERPTQRGVPRRIERAVLRGLSTDPDHRFATMEALLAELREPPTNRRTVVVAALGVASVAVVAIVMTREPSALDRCLDAVDGARPSWTGEPRDRARAAFEATGAAYARATFDRSEHHLEAYAEQLAAAHDAMCREAHETATATTAMLDLRAACLDRARDAANAAIAVLGEADAATVRNAARLLEGLPRIERCSDPAALGAIGAPPGDPGVAAQVVEARAGIDRAAALGRAGRYAEALAVADEVVRTASGIDHRPIVIEAADAQAEARRSIGRLEEGIASMREVHFGALGAGLDALAYESAWKLAADIGVRQGAAEPGQQWLDTATALHERIAAGEGERARLLGLRADIAKLAGEYTETAALYAEAIAIAEEAGYTALTAKLLNDRWDALRLAGRWDEADAMNVRAFELARELYGETHPDTARPLANRAVTAMGREDYPAAEAQARAALDILEEALDPDSPDLATVLNVLGVAVQEQGEARHEEARAIYERALRIREQASGLAHRETFMLLNNLGRLLWLDHRLEEALAYQRRAYESAVASVGPDHPHVANAHTGVGSTLWEMGDAKAAVVELDAALAIFEARDVDPAERARTQFLLARALWDTGERIRATSLARAAHATLAVVPGASEPRRALASWSRSVGLVLGDADEVPSAPAPDRVPARVPARVPIRSKPAP